MPRVTVILNPHAGPSGQAPPSEVVAAAFAAAGEQAVVVATDGATATVAAERARDAGSTVIVAAGGDGTVSAVASALAGTRTVLGVLPVGTLNHFARDLHIPTDLTAAVNTIVNGRVATIDIGDVNGRIFINNSSVGLYPRLVWEREREQRRGRRKWQAFAIALGRVWRRYRRVAVVVQGERVERTVHTPFVFVGNGEYQIEGPRIGVRHQLDTGSLHVCMAPGLRRVDVTRVLLAALVGRLRDIEQFDSLLVSELSVSTRRRRLGVAIDGEVVILSTPLHYRARRQALQVLVPA